MSIRMRVCSASQEVPPPNRSIQLPSSQNAGNLGSIAQTPNVILVTIPGPQPFVVGYGEAQGASSFPAWLSVQREVPVGCIFLTGGAGVYIAPSCVSGAQWEIPA